MRGRPLMLVVLAAALAAPSLSARQTLTADDLFDNSQVQRLDLFINSRDYATLQELYLTNDYYTADLVFRGQRVRNVGVRSRGSAAVTARSWDSRSSSITTRRVSNSSASTRSSWTTSTRIRRCSAKISR